jgi:kynureninase
MITVEQCRALDDGDRLRPLRDLFVVPEGTIYLDGNSLGALPAAARARVRQVVDEEWGQGLIRSWNDAGWYPMPGRVGDKIARLIGAGPGEVVATDSTSVNLYKVLSAAFHLVDADRPARIRVVTERTNFPTDLYIIQTLCQDRAFTLQMVEAEDVSAALSDETAVVALTHVNYRTGAMHDLAGVTAAAHAAGALMIWDLAHSAGAVPVDLHAAGADFAVGCGYKYLNGGPGAPAFVWVNPKHADRFVQPLAGWFGHASPFEFSSDYRPASGVARYLCGTPPVISLAALECGVDSLLAAEPMGGIAALREKSVALTDLFIALVDERCAGHGLLVVSPRDAARRGSQVCLTRVDPEDAPRSGGYAIVQALIARGIVGDFRAGDGGRLPDILRFGFTPLYLRFVDVWDAVEQLRQVLESGEWRREEFSRSRAVT